MNYPKYVIVHHSGGTDANPLQDSSNYTLHQCDQDHKVRFNMHSSLGYWVGYNYFMDKQGIITQTRTDFEEGAHCKGYNNSAYDKHNHPENLAIGICLAGNFDATLPTQAQKDSLTKFLKEKTALYNIQLDHIVPHRTFAIKSCYGDKLSDTWAAELLKPKTPVVDKPLPSNFWQILQQNLSNFFKSNGQKP